MCELMRCPLCTSSAHFFFEKRKPLTPTKQYFECDTCSLIFLDPAHHLPIDAEKKIYQNHNNSIEHEGYVAFLYRLITPLLHHIPKGSHGLDFGSGPGPTLHTLLERHGMKMDIYDPYFSPQEKLLLTQYDFVTATEVIEHFCSPEKSFALLHKLLRPKGYLALMTQVVKEKESFATWWYHQDPSHVSFYQDKTFEWLADSFTWNLIRPAETVVLFQKKENVENKKATQK